MIFPKISPGKCSTPGSEILTRLAQFPTARAGLSRRLSSNYGIHAGRAEQRGIDPAQIEPATSKCLTGRLSAEKQKRADMASGYLSVQRAHDHVRRDLDGRFRWSCSKGHSYASRVSAVACWPTWALERSDRRLCVSNTSRPRSLWPSRPATIRPVARPSCGRGWPACAPREWLDGPGFTRNLETRLSANVAHIVREPRPPPLAIGSPPDLPQDDRHQ